MKQVLFAAALCLIAPLEASADAVQTSHGLSAFGDLKYAADFEHFDYVNPDAPKGGEIRTTSTLATATFDSLNAYILKGDAPEGMTGDTNLVFDSMMVRAFDEPDAVYGLLAKHAEFIPGKWITFEMREEARFSDGSPVTAEDAAFTFSLLKEQAHPAYREVLRDVENAEALGPLRVKYTFSEGAASRTLPMTVATLPVFSKAFYTEQDFEEPSMTPPIGSGPYKIGKVNPALSATYERRDDYWAEDLPVNVGRWNFDAITFEYFRDRAAALEALFAGKLDLNEDFFSKQWATAYDVPAIEDGRVVRGTLPDGRPAGTQGYWFNTRRETLSDPRVREAIALAFDFEWSNASLFYGLYERTNSFFEGAPFEAEGNPSDAELALLEPFRGELPEAVFGTAFVPPKTDGTGNRDRKRRANLRRGMELLDAAGWTLREGKRVNADGEPLKVEFLDRNGSFFGRITNPFIKNLERLGIDATFRQVDKAQYQRRFESFDFDIVTSRLTFALTPGGALRNTFGSDAATNEGSFNLAGIEIPAIDDLIEIVLNAESREEMETALRAIDRVLRAGHYWVPQWTKTVHTVAWWDRFERPETKPPLTRGILSTWWSKDKVEDVTD